MPCASCRRKQAALQKQAKKTSRPKVVPKNDSPKVNSANVNKTVVRSPRPQRPNIIRV